MKWQGLLEETRKMQGELVQMRRYLHENAETGFALKKTGAFVEEKLKKMGYAPKKCGKAGVMATIGKADARGAFLLRADMDALPIVEETGLSFACKDGNMHACGHDMHTAMLLGAAKLIKEKGVRGGVKFLFQPAEEILEGANDVLQDGVLKSPSVGAAMSMHVLTSADLPTGTLVVASPGVSAPAADFFTIEVQGQSCHGSAPWNGVDALTVAACIVVALQEISAREISVSYPFVLTMGALNAGKAGNVIADFAILKGTLRAFDEQTRERVKIRVEEIAKGIARTYRAKASVRYEGGCPTLVNDKKLSFLAEQTAKEMFGEERVYTSEQLSGGVRAANGGSEDFAYITQKVPSITLALAAGRGGYSRVYPLHHPKVKFDEEALCVGAAAYAGVALAWLREKE